MQSVWRSSGLNPYFLRKIVGPILALLLVLGCPLTWAASALRVAANDAIGSGDGRIHIIPSLSAMSVKNGRRVSIQSVVKAVDGVARVDATIERKAAPASAMGLLNDGTLDGLLNLPVAELDLKAAPVNMGGVNVSSTLGIWQTDWEAEGLEEGYYRIAVTVTDRSGHSFTDRSLEFTDPIAGLNTAGSAAYPSGGMTDIDATELHVSETMFLSAVVDSTHGYAYFGTGAGLFQARVVKVALGSGAEAPRRIGQLMLNSGEKDLYGAAIDPEHGYAYFVSHTSPSTVVKIKLGEGDSVPTRIAALTLDGGEEYARSAVLDATHGYLYVATSPGMAIQPSVIVKIDVGSGDATPARVAALTLDGGKNNAGNTLIDATHGYAYVGASTGYNPTVPLILKMSLGSGTDAPSLVGVLELDPSLGTIQEGADIDIANGYAYYTLYRWSSSSLGYVAKIALGSGDAAPTFIGSAAFTIDNPITTLLLDATHGYCYVGGRVSPGVITKVALGSGDVAPSVVNSLTLESTETSIESGVIDPVNGYAWFGLNSGHVVKVALGSGDAVPTRLGSVSGLTGPQAAVADLANGYAYFGTYESPGKIVRVALGSGDALPAIVDTLTLNPGENYLYGAAIDTTNGYAYFTTSTTPGIVVKVLLGTNTIAPARVGSLALNSNENSAYFPSLDVAHGYGYVSTNTSPLRVIKVALGSGADLPTRTSALLFPATESHLYSAVLDEKKGYAYFGTYDVNNIAPGGVVKVALGEGDAAPVRVGALMLDEGEMGLLSAVIDPSNGYAYFGTNTSPGKVVKVALGEGNAIPTRIGAVTLNEGENQLSSASIDAEHGYALFGTNTYPVSMVKIALGANNAGPSRIGAVALDSSYGGSLYAMSPNAVNEYAVLASYSSPAYVAKIAVGEGDAAPVNAAATSLHIGEAPYRAALIDTLHGYAYFGTNDSPGCVLKVALGEGSNAPRRIDKLTLDSGENALYCGIIDPDGGYAWFGTYTSPGRVVKIALGEGDASPTRVGAATLNAGISNPVCTIVDPTHGYVYYGTNTSPGMVAKVRMGAGATAPSLVGVLALNAGENALQTAVYDSENGIGYFGTNTSPGIIVKVNLNPTSDAAPARMGALTLHSGEDNLSCSVLDASSGYACFGTGTSPGRVVKVRLDGATPTYVGSVALESGEDALRSAAIDTPHGYAYLGTGTSPGRVVKVALGAGDTPPARVNAVVLNSGENTLNSAVIDPAAGYAYFGAYAATGRVIKVALGAGAAAPTRIGALTLNSGERYLRSAAAIDTANGHAYFGTGTSPGRVVKVALGAGDALPTRVDSVTLNTGENSLYCAALDTANGYGYFASNAMPGIVVKIALGAGASAPTRIDSLMLPGNEYQLSSACIDSVNGYGYFGTYTSPGTVVKVDLGQGAELPARVGAVTLPTGEDNLNCAAIDAANGYGYFGTYTSPGMAVKVKLGDADALPTRIGSTTFTTAERNACSIALDTANGYGYFGMYTSPGRVVKVALGSGDAAPSRTAGMILSSGEDQPYTAFLDPDSGYGYFGTYTFPGKLVKVALGVGSATPTRSDVLSLASSESYLYGGVTDGIYAWLATTSSPAYIVRVGLSEKGFLKATKVSMTEAGALQSVSFYSHAAVGNVRLALYDDSTPPALLWQSGSVANTAAESWLTVPVGDGTPSSLFLTAGTYWLAWQTDTATPIASCTVGNAGAGFYVPMTYGDYPARLDAGHNTAPTPTAETWSEYLTYLAAPAAPSNPTSTCALNAISWGWTDNASDETGFKVYADPGAAEPITLQAMLATPDLNAWTKEDLSPNTPYAFQVSAYNANGDSAKTNALTAYTLIEPVQALTFASVDMDSLSVASANRPSNLAAGNSGLQFANTTLGTASVWQQDNSAWTSSGLTANAPYVFIGQSRNGDSVATQAATATKYTLAASPAVGDTISCAQSLSTLYPAGTTFVFSNPVGFGESVHGGASDRVSAFKYTWDSASTHTFTGVEPVWSSGVLPQSPTVSGNYYLHLQSLNGDGVGSSALDYGPFSIDVDVPTVTISLSDPSPTGKDVVHFSADFSKNVGATFDISDVMLTGTLSGTPSVTGTDPHYVVTIVLANTEANGTIGITVGNNVSDAAGNKCPGGSSTPYAITQWPGLSSLTNVRTYIGDEYTFAVPLNADLSPSATYQWKWDNGAKTAANGPITSTWKMTGLTSANQGLYWCEVTYDGETHISTKATLNTAEHLQIVNTLENASSTTGASHTFTVVVNGGYEPLKYVWSKDDVEIDGATTAIYTRSKLTESDAGTYSVEIIDANTDVQRATATLTVTPGLSSVNGSFLMGVAGLLLLVGARCIARRIPETR